MPPTPTPPKNPATSKAKGTETDIIYDDIHALYCGLSFSARLCVLVTGRRRRGRGGNGKKREVRRRRGEGKEGKGRRRVWRGRGRGVEWRR